MARKKKVPKPPWPAFDQKWPHGTWSEKGTKMEQETWRNARNRWHRCRAEHQLIEASQALLDLGFMSIHVGETLTIYQESIVCGAWNVATIYDSADTDENTRFQCDAQRLVLDVFVAGVQAQGGM